MLKKILAMCALVATVSFAEWDMFPILPQGKGEVVGAMQIKDQDPVSMMTGETGVRFSPLSFMELYLKLDYLFFTHIDGEDAELDGLGNLPVGVKFQLNQSYALFFDAVLPIGDEDINYDYTVFQIGISHVNLYTNLAWGSEFGVTFYLEDDVYVFNFGDEWDILLGRFVPYFVFDLAMGIYAGPEEDDYASGFQLGFGAKFSITEAVSIDFSMNFLLGDLYESFGCDDPKLYTLAVFYRF